MTPSRSRSNSWTPQKQPPARMAVSVLSLIALSLLRSSVSVAPAAAKQLEREQEDVEDVEEDRGGDRHRGIGGAAAQAVEVEDRERAEDPESGDRVDEVAVGDRYEDRDDAEDDQGEQGPEQSARPGREVSARRVAVGAAARDERRGGSGRLPQSGRVGVGVGGDDRGDRQATRRPSPNSSPIAS